MAKRVLIPGAGTGASNNLVRSLKEGDGSLVVLGCHDDRFTLKKSSADRKLLVPPATHPRFTDALQRLIETERVDLVIPNTDRDVRMISDLRDTLPCRVFLPDKDAIDVCHDKYELTML